MKTILCYGDSNTWGDDPQTGERFPRPMGMYTAVSSTDEWLEKFGVDVEEIDRWELVRRSEEIEGSKVRAAREWLEGHAAGSNHIYAIPGDHVEELRVVCRLLDVDYDGFGGAA